ncbi:AAA family ATPase [Opitutales bacterium]|nr:AAA family ATPase [Opitutales bacterium]
MLKLFKLLNFTTLLSLGFTAFGNYPTESIEKLIRHADTTYWLGQAEKGDVRLFNRGLSALEQAEALCQELPDKKKASTQARIDGLRTDIIEQKEMAHDTLWGVFPLLRFTIFDKDNWEWFDDPKIMSTSRATVGLRDTLIQNWRNLPQMDVAYAALEQEDSRRVRSYTLENETAYLINENPKFFNHNALEIATALSPEQADIFYTQGMNQEIGDLLCESFGIKRLIEFRIEEMDQFGNDHFFVAKAALHEKGEGIGEARTFVYGFTRDVTSRIWWIIAPIIILLGFSTFMRSFFDTASKIPGWLGPCGYLIGFAVTCVGANSLSPLLPLAEMIVQYGFWYICMCGAIFITLPCLLGILLIRKFLGTNSPNNPLLWFTCLFPFALGGISFSAYPVFTYLPFNEAVVVFASFLLIGTTSTIAISIALGTKGLEGGSSYGPSVFNLAKLGIAGAFGYALYILPEGDTNSFTLAGLGAPALFAMLSMFAPSPKGTNALLIGVLLGTTGGIFFMTGSTGLMIACGASSLLAVPMGLRYLLTFQTIQVEQEQTDSSEFQLDQETSLEQTRCNFSQQLRKCREGKAPFSGSSNFSDAKNKIHTALDNKSMLYLRIHGQAGSGKTRMAKELIYQSSGKALLIFQLECDVSAGQNTPYASISKILERTGNSLSLNGEEIWNDSLTSELFGIMESVIPFGNLVGETVNQSETQSTPTSGEIAVSLLKSFQKCTEDDGVNILIFIDNAEKIDPASREVIDQLINLTGENPSQNALTVIECSRQKIEQFDPNDWFSSYSPSIDVNNFLCSTLSIDTSISKSLSLQTGGHNISPTLLLNWMEHASDSGFFDESTAPFRRHPNFKEDLPSPPESVYDSMQLLIEKLPHDCKTTLEHAACIGLSFDLEALNFTRERSKGAILDHLEEAEEAGLVEDIPDEDEQFRFTSPIILECLERILCFSGLSNLRQRAIETHKKLADLHSRNLDSNLFQAARHASLSGSGYSEKALPLCVKAAEKAFQLNAFIEAKEYAQKAISLSERDKHPKINLRWTALRIYLQSFEITGTLNDFPATLEKMYMELVSSDSSAQSDEKSRLCATLAISLAKFDNFDDSLQCLNKASDSQSGSTLAQLEIAHAHAFLEMRQGKCLEAIQSLDEVLQNKSDGQEGLATKQATAKALDSRANAKLNQQDERISSEQRSSAIDDINHSLKIKREIGDKAGQAMSLGTLGRYYLLTKNDKFFKEHSVDAVSAFEEDLKISEEIGDLIGQLKMPGLIAGCHRRSKDYETAIQHYQTAESKARKHKSTLDLAFALSGLAFCYNKLGRDNQSDKIGKKLAQEISGMESKTLSHLRYELKWLDSIGLEKDWVEKIKSAEESL